MRRRTFLETLGMAGLASALPRLGLTQSGDSDVDVKFLVPADPDYALHNVPFNKRIKKKPKLIAVCSTENGVARAIARARAEGLAVAIKSGGHSFEGFSLNDGGLVIDLTPMQHQELRPDGSYIVGPSCRLMQTYEYLVPRERLIPAGSCGMVGVAGLTLGGGYGLFSRQHGLTCDSLRGLRMVDGTGRVHDVADGSDLFWACRGGGNGHFGVVTQLRFDTVAAPRKMWRHVFRATNLTPARAASLAETWFALATEFPNEVFSAFVLNHRRLTVLVTSTNDVEPPSLTRHLKQLEAAMDRRVARLQEDLMPAIRRYYGKLSPLYFKNASAGYYRGYDDIRATAVKIFEVVTQTPELLFQVNTLGGAIDNPALADKTAYVHRSYGFLGEIQSYWDDPQREQIAMHAVSRTQRLLKEAGVHSHYCNYPDIEFPDWAQSYYGGKGYERLLKVKDTYDPQRLFRYAQGVGSA